MNKNVGVMYSLSPPCVTHYILQSKMIVWDGGGRIKGVLSDYFEDFRMYER